MTLRLGDTVATASLHYGHHIFSVSVIALYMNASSSKSASNSFVVHIHSQKAIVDIEN